MKTYPNDEQLRELLRRSWIVSPKPDPGFREAVWARIEAGRRLPATWGGWLKLNIAHVTTCAAASIVLAGIGGGLIAANQADRDREQLIQRYMLSIDPHQRANTENSP